MEKNDKLIFKLIVINSNNLNNESETKIDLQELQTQNEMTFKMMLIDAYAKNQEEVPYGIKTILNKSLQMGNFKPLFDLITESEQTFVKIVKDKDVEIPLNFFKGKVSDVHIKNYILNHFKYKDQNWKEFFDLLVSKNGFYLEEYLVELIEEISIFDKKLYYDVAKHYMYFIKTFKMQFKLLNNNVIDLSQFENLLLNGNITAGEIYKLAAHKLLNFRGVGKLGIERELELLSNNTDENAQNYSQALLELCVLVKQAREAYINGDITIGYAEKISKLYKIGTIYGNYLSAYTIDNMIVDTIKQNKVYKKKGERISYDDESTDPINLD